MKSDKIKIEIDLLRDSLRNIFFVMFALVSGEVSLLYKIFHKENFVSIVFSVIGFLILVLLYFVQISYKKEIKSLLKQLEDKK